MSSVKYPIPAAGVLIFKNGKVLLGKRLSKHGFGTWSPPGGKIELGEAIEDCAKRETLEEVGIKIENPKFVGITNNIFENEKKHTITIFFIATEFSGEPKVMEPEKIAEWSWFDWNNLPKPLFLPVELLLKQGYNPLS